MGAHSTINITRSKAKQVMVSKILGDITDEDLENFMDDILYDRLYNCNIVPDNWEDNDDQLV